MPIKTHTTNDYHAPSCTLQLHHRLHIEHNGLSCAPDCGKVNANEVSFHAKTRDRVTLLHVRQRGTGNHASARIEFEQCAPSLLSLQVHVVKVHAFAEAGRDCGVGFWQCSRSWTCHSCCYMGVCTSVYFFFLVNMCCDNYGSCRVESVQVPFAHF